MDTVIESRVLGSLKQNFGFDQFKGEQESIVKSVLNGNDNLVIMPTGGGKSLCYQLPALMMDGAAIIISPLIALMKNQVDLVRGYSSNDNIAHFLNSSLNRQQIRTVKEDLQKGETKLLYVAPETLGKESTIEFLRTLQLSFVAIDEAHCISEWGHDFRPEYRRISAMIDEINPDMPVIALTATATPKVQNDIMKTLKMRNPQIFISSFNRQNLYYEVRPKPGREETIKNLVQFVKSNAGKSGIVYCLNRKTTEEIAEVLQVNGVKAAPYHAGMEAHNRSTIQDQFLMEEVQVICATIAFGMGIDKPDVRFVIHFDIPKSLENYYQETGRAGRDGLEGRCIAYFNYTDITKLEKFMRDKPVKEREIGGQHLLEVVGYSETAVCRRKYVLHYFGENYLEESCNNCDNCLHPKERREAKEDIKIALKAVQAVNESFNIKYVAEFLMGKKTQDILSFKHDKHKLFGKGSDKEMNFWNAALRQALLHDLLVKDIEEYGVLKLSDKGREFIDRPFSIKVALNNEFSNIPDVDESSGGIQALDPVLLQMLRDVRKIVAKEKKMPPFVIFQDISLEDMATLYPITMAELENITGVSKGKAEKFGEKFVEVIAKYVAENGIERESDFVIKQIANKSKSKVFIITNIDKKIPLEQIAKTQGFSMEEMWEEIESIISSGTKLNFDYHINDMLDRDQQNEIIEYFMTAETDEIKVALKELDDEFTFEEIRAMRLKFLSEMGN